MFIKNENKDDCLIAGYVVGDQKVKEFEGKQFVEFGIGMGKDSQGENLPIINITIWERQIPTIKKGDRVLAGGKLKVTKKDDKKYYSLNADFCIKEVTAAEQKQEEPDYEPIDINDDDLPF